ncbi:adenylosuccinate synthetase [Anaeromicropila populeti]|uniref:Adenylosuccinate synthetase n=1 Tax=Anaeromicropila populeti TaxID=37658 RepID=A0A1I6IDZ7_9FIRM|nr:adenylosuccinate synthetase [Anaeromicropila populeti]SFR64997.1 adenylosuccinate synthase [Anaeromicropila populeti]
MKMAKVVIGANFGDEGKGLMTDYFGANSKNPIVIRFNGGAQAGHTVVTTQGTRHVFSHFGAGSLLGVPTYLSQFFAVNPLIFFKEWEELKLCFCRKKNPVFPKVMVSENCMVTTPYDMLINQVVESQRGAGRHGSCGLGFYETILRNQKTEYQLTVQELLDLKRKGSEGRYKIRKKLDFIRQSYVKQRFCQLGITMVDDNLLSVLQSDGLLEDSLEQMRQFVDEVRVVNFETAVKDFDTLLFEGAQGLMLHQSYRYFPHVTPSNTGMENVVELLTPLKSEISEIEAVYVTRTYLTRHGAGPLPGELKEKPYENIVDLTNQPNEYQGKLRFAYLDVTMLKENVDNDLERVKNSGFSIKPALAITCLNQPQGNIVFIKNKRKQSATKKTFLQVLQQVTGIEELYVSWGENRNCVDRY